MKIARKTKYVIASAAVSLWIVLILGCPKATMQKSPNTIMEDNQTQQVERARRALEEGWDGSITVLRQHAEDEREEVRRDIYALYWRIGIASSEQSKRAAVLEFMLDKTVAETPMLRGQLLKWMQDFRKEDFNQNAKLRLETMPWTDEYNPEVIRLVGIAELSQAEPRLKAEIKERPLTQSPPTGYELKNTWAALLALSRMGDETALSTVIERVQQENDIITRASRLFYDLGYTRRPAAFDVLKKYLNSDQRLPRIKDNVPGRLEASHAAAVFSKYIRGFPISETDFSEQQTAQARDWVNAQSSWQFK